MSLQLSHVSVSLEKKRILSMVDLTVEPAKVHALMGPNGAGKSTLALALAGHPFYSLSKASSIMLDGTELTQLAPDERSQLGLFLAFQYPVEVPGVKVQSFLRQAYHARFADNPEKLFDKVIQFRDHLYSLAKELSVSTDLLTRGLNEGFSGGEKKRLEVLQMALLEPKYAILDETDSGLDIDAIKAVAHGIQTVKKRHKTGIIIITHYQRILQYVQPDVVHVMKKGAVVETGGIEIVERLEEDGYGS
ncbi:Fe-S cluster assembly ATPase SufC [Candidatus Woesebacteria bacterium]|nr:Fe-S cluster assembly ATPase SufC [Candidatus Woesebacteria bacterium]